VTTLLVASTGGHLSELYLLRRYLVGPDEDVVWVTFDNTQSRSLLHGEPVEHLPFIGPRQLGRVLAGRRAAKRLFVKYDVTRVLSTGSAIALSVLPLAARRGIACEYVEAAARTDGPSTTGALLTRVKGVRTFTQWDCWASERWPVTTSVFENYRPDAPVEPLYRLRKVVVSVGTIEGYGFRRLIERLAAILPADCEVLWQTGSTDVSGLPIHGIPLMPPETLQAAMCAADVVVCHAGVGSALSVLALGHRPVLVPRRAAHGEHIDDHQCQIAAELRDRELGVYFDADELTYEGLLRAAAKRVAPSPERRRSGGRERFLPRPDRPPVDASMLVDEGVTRAAS
jgi:UDP-N-acetylglucosamine--N-acetylmuramyl-(pentapeptide) pyrophosphoryl-undecaprenol N-acetylglucosamine transferase